MKVLVLTNNLHGGLDPKELTENEAFRMKFVHLRRAGYCNPDMLSRLAHHVDRVVVYLDHFDVQNYHGRRNPLVELAAEHLDKTLLVATEAFIDCHDKSLVQPELTGIKFLVSGNESTFGELCSDLIVANIPNFDPLDRGKETLRPPRFKPV